MSDHVIIIDGVEYDREVLDTLHDAQWKGFLKGLSEYETEEDHPFVHFCRKCINIGKVIFVAFVVEMLMFYPTHLLFHELGWL